MLKKSDKVIIKTDEQVEGIRRSSQLTARTLDYLAGQVRPGITTEELDRLAHEFIRDHGAVPAPLGYRGYPKSICASINDVILHGIPDSTALKDGDIVNVDVTTILDGYYGDASRMFCLGEVSRTARKLVDVTRECLEHAINQVRPGATLGHIGYVCQRHAEAHGYSVVRDFVGHGIGVDFHEPPDVLHYGRKGHGLVLKPNMTFTIEPMINQGTHRGRACADGWTVVTADGKLSAQWEHTVLVTRTGVEVLTTC